MRILLIGNPVAGRGRAPGAIEALVGSLRRKEHDVEVFLTAGAGDAKARASAVGTDWECLVVAGGDGTLNEVVNGLRDPSLVPVAQLPLGTANVLARELGLPRDPEKVAELVDRGATRAIDLGVLGDRRFLCVASAGFDAAVVQAIHASRRGSLGFRGYALPVLRTLLGYRAPDVVVRVDDAPPVKGAMVVVSNTRNYGGILRIADRASCDSGRLDVCVLRRRSVPALLGYGISALRGHLSRRSDVAYLTGRRIRLESPEPVPVEVDGDYWGETPVEIGVVPGALRVVVPAPRRPGNRERKGRDFDAPYARQPPHSWNEHAPTPVHRSRNPCLSLPRGVGMGHTVSGHGKGDEAGPGTVQRGRGSSGSRDDPAGDSLGL